MRRRLLHSALAGLLAAGLAACGGSDDSKDDGSDTASTSGDLSGVSITGDFGEKPTIKIDGLDVDEAESAEIIVGDGDEVTEDSYVDYRFAIVNGSGEEVATNFTANDAQQLIVAQQPDEIKKAVVGSHIGSRVAIAIPVTDLVGEEGAPQAGLEPGDDMVLVFDMVELGEPPLSGPEGEEVDPPADAPKVVGGSDGVTGLDFSDAPADPPGKLQVITLIEGEGDAVKEGDSITVDYFGAVWGNEKEPFDESFSREPATFTLAQGGLIEGWVQGLQGVTVGSRVMLVIPPEQGYGEAGSGDKIPGDSTLVFVIDVLAIG